jgi:hemerythrin
MAFLSWRPGYELGVRMIDSEHRFLFELINEFHDTHQAGGDRGEVLRVLTRLIAYAETHFQHEQALMADEGYPRLDHHLAAHDELVMAIFRLNEGLEAGGANVDGKTLRFLQRWLVDHIVKEDLDFADYLRGKALKAAREKNAPAAPEKAMPAAGALAAGDAATETGAEASAGEEVAPE